MSGNLRKRLLLIILLGTSCKTGYQSSLTDFDVPIGNQPNPPSPEEQELALKIADDLAQAEVLKMVVGLKAIELQYLEVRRSKGLKDFRLQFNAVGEIGRHVSRFGFWGFVFGSSGYSVTSLIGSSSAPLHLNVLLALTLARTTFRSIAVAGSISLSIGVSSQSWGRDTLPEKIETAILQNIRGGVLPEVTLLKSALEWTPAQESRFQQRLETIATHYLVKKLANSAGEIPETPIYQLNNHFADLPPIDPLDIIRDLSSKRIAPDLRLASAAEIAAIEEFRKFTEAIIANGEDISAIRLDQVLTPQRRNRLDDNLKTIDTLISLLTDIRTELAASPNSELELLYQAAVKSRDRIRLTLS